MLISGINNYSVYGMNAQALSASKLSGDGAGGLNSGFSGLAINNPSGISNNPNIQTNSDGDTYTKVNKNNPNYECQTCKNRKYQDGSDEMVSFKSPAHVSPQAAGSAVRAHEQEHVANAYDKANRDNGEVIQASVQIHTAICPECGRSYVAGGTTSTQIKYTNEKNPYQQDLIQKDAGKYSGMNVDMAG